MNLKMKKRITASSSSSSSLPLELIYYEILSWLPVKHLARFKCVSKSWCGLINHPNFIKLHLARSLQGNSDTTFILESFEQKFNICSLRINYRMHPFYHVTELCYPNELIKERPRVSWAIDSCNGLLCFTSIITGKFGCDIDLSVIYNPTTRAYQKLPVFNFNKERTFIYLYWILGFGYDCVSDDYKVLRSEKEPNDSGTTELVQKSMLYSLKANVWEVIENPPWDVRLISSSAIMANNSFHWLHPKCEEVKCFDLFTRRYYEMPLPRRICRYSPKLTIFKGHLCLVTYCLDIWILKEYGANKSWTQLFRNLSRRFVVSSDVWDLDLRIACVKDGHNNFILAVSPIAGGEPPPGLFICCNVESEEARKIQMPGFPKNLRLAASQPWVESLVPLRAWVS